MDFDFYDYDNLDFDYFPLNQPEQQTSPFIQTTTKQMIDSFDEIVFGNRDSVSIKNLGDIIDVSLMRMDDGELKAVAVF